MIPLLGSRTLAAKGLGSVPGQGIKMAKTWRHSQRKKFLGVSLGNVMKEEKLSVYKYSVCNSMYNSDKLKLNVQWYEDNLLYDKLDVFVFLSNMKTVMK